jgi:hypothetical protein
MIFTPSTSSTVTYDPRPEVEERVRYAMSGLLQDRHFAALPHHVRTTVANVLAQEIGLAMEPGQAPHNAADELKSDNEVIALVKKASQTYAETNPDFAPCEPRLYGFSWLIGQNTDYNVMVRASPPPYRLVQYEFVQIGSLRSLDALYKNKRGEA